MCIRDRCPTAPDTHVPQPVAAGRDKLGVPEPVGVAELQQPAGAVGDPDEVAELTQHPVVGARRVGLVATPVAAAAHEQEPRLLFGIARAQPALLFLDDRGDLAVDRMLSGAISILLWAYRN